MPEGDDYESLRPVVTINFLEYAQDVDGEAIREYRLPNTDHLVIFHVELPKFVGRAAEDLNPAEIWGKFLEEPGNEHLAGTAVAADLDLARSRMEAFMSLTPEVVREIQLSMYDHDVATIKKIARREGHAEGLATGSHRRELEIARKMKGEGFPDDVIARVTGVAPGEL